jgi:FkbM family methyltransferase
MKQYAGLWFPDDEGLTKALRARLDTERVYRGDRLEEALALVKSRRVAVDCGANVGMWTRELARHFEQVIAVEPSRPNVECLEVNTAGLRNVRIIHAALGSQQGRVALDTSKGAFSSMVVPGTGSTPMTTINALDLQNVDYVKIHVNGFEERVLWGASKTLREWGPVLTVVLKPKLAEFDSDPDEIVTWLDEMGYRMAGGQKPYRIFVRR